MIAFAIVGTNSWLEPRKVGGLKIWPLRSRLLLATFQADIAVWSIQRLGRYKYRFLYLSKLCTLLRQVSSLSKLSFDWRPFSLYSLTYMQKDLRYSNFIRIWANSIHWQEVKSSSLRRSATSSVGRQDSGVSTVERLDRPSIERLIAFLRRHVL